MLSERCVLSFLVKYLAAAVTPYETVAVFKNKYHITGYFQSINFCRTLDKLNFELVAELENILTCTILYAL